MGTGYGSGAVGVWTGEGGGGVAQAGVRWARAEKSLGRGLRMAGLCSGAHGGGDRGGGAPGLIGGAAWSSSSSEERPSPKERSSSSAAAERGGVGAGEGIGRVGSGRSGRRVPEAQEQRARRAQKCRVPEGQEQRTRRV